MLALVIEILHQKCLHPFYPIFGLLILPTHTWVECALANLILLQKW